MADGSNPADRSSANDEVAPIPAVHETATELGGSIHLRHFIPASTGVTGRSGKRRLAAEATVRPDEHHVSAPRRGQLAVLTACVDAMRDLPLRKMLEEVILA